MATTVGIVEGFDLYDNNDHTILAGMPGVTYSASGWSLGQTGRLANYSANGPANTTNTLIMDVDRLTSAAITDTCFIMCGLKPNLASGQRRFRILDSSDVAHVDIEISATGAFVAKRGDGTSLGTSATGLVADGVWGTLEIKVTVNDSAGIVQVKWDGVQILNITASDTQNAGASEAAKIEFSPDGGIDDIVVMIAATGDSFPGPRKVVRKMPATDASVQFSPNTGAVNAEMVDDDPSDEDVTYNASSTATHRDEMNYETVSETGAIDGIRHMFRAKKTDVGVRKMKHTHNDGLNPAVDSATESALTTDYAMYDEFNPTKPAGGAWAAADVNNTDHGYVLST